MKCKICGSDEIYFYCVLCKSKGKNEKAFLHAVDIDMELMALIKGGYRICENCHSKTTLDDLTCKFCGHITILY